MYTITAKINSPAPFHHSVHFYVVINRCIVLKLIIVTCKLYVFNSLKFLNRELITRTLYLVPGRYPTSRNEKFNLTMQFCRS
jgi:hypothetical protein